MIDLAQRWNEVRKLVMSQYARVIHANGWDEDDVMQDIYLALMVRNHGTCPWDADRGSWASYVLMVSSGVIRNGHVKDTHRIQTTELPEDCEANSGAASPEAVVIGLDLQEYLKREAKVKRGMHVRTKRRRVQQTARSYIMET